MTGDRKLSYTRAAFIRRIAMSRDKSFLVVEGREFDVPFYSRICESSRAVKVSGYQIWLAEQIREDITGSGRGGKPGVLSLFDYCKTRKSLRVASPLGEKALTFCLDRDNEQITGGGRRSPHILYTRKSDVEAEIFSHGLNDDVLMSTLSLDRSTAQTVVKSLGDWRLELAHSWRDWIELCCLAKRLGAKCDVGFGSESTINRPKYGVTDPALAAAARARVIARSSLPHVEVVSHERLIATRITAVYARGNPRDLLKGKWIPAFLESKIRSHFGKAPVSFNGFSTAIKVILVHALDYSAAWATPYRQRLEANL
ncbi:hypothetical protein [Streptomyces sp. BBFR109]|uniref:hypothetical protein n=1 Tax=Streptomyces sp. BBFR109 TaxID=3448172 RepID=UPI003F764387